jgi:hypothetical protein
VFHLHYGGSKNVVLPGKFAHCFAQGDMVAFVTKQGHVVVWGWSDNAIELDIDHSQHSHQPNGWEGYFGGVPGVMFHPTDTDVVFGAWLHSPPHPGKRCLAGPVLFCLLKLIMCVLPLALQILAYISSSSLSLRMAGR